MMDDRLLYVVSATITGGTITYRCPTAEWALKKNRNFLKAEYAGINIRAPDGTLLNEADLVRLAGLEAKQVDHLDKVALSVFVSAKATVLTADIRIEGINLFW